MLHMHTWEPVFYVQLVDVYMRLATVCKIPVNRINLVQQFKCANILASYISTLNKCVFSAFLSLVSKTPHLVRSAPFLSLSLSLIAECEMTHGMRQSTGHTQLSGNEKWCWCQRWNRPNHPWAELHNSNIILLLPLLFYPLSLPCPLAHSPSLTLSSNRFDFYSSMFQWHRRSSERRVLGLERGSSHPSQQSMLGKARR